MKVTLHIDGKPVTLENVERRAQEISFTFAGKSYRFHSEHLSCATFMLDREKAEGVWERKCGTAWQAKDSRRVQLGAPEASITEQPKNIAQTSAKTALSPTAPMPGVIRQILVKAGDKVKTDQPLIVMEAMKLQTTLCAGGEGKVEAVLVKVGEMVSEGAELVRLKKAP